jgi:hypothetical protein
LAVTAAQLVAVVKTEGVEQSKAKLDEMSGAVEHTSGGFKSMLGNALSFAAGQFVFNAVGQSIGFLKDQLVGCVQESLDAQAGMAQTNQVLKSTHDASGMTAQAVADLAGNLSHLTKFSDDTVQASENMLLTFTNIGKNVFPQATKTVLDMSQALGQDTKNSAIQLGKALNDPIAGITALSRVGVTFSQTQKDQIKHFMDANQIAKAQGVILGELQKEFGGSAEAAGKTFGGQLAILKQRLSDVKQTIGDALLPILTKLVGFVSDNIGPAFDNLGKAFRDVKDTATQVGQILKTTFLDLGIKNPFAGLLSSGDSLKNLGSNFHDTMMTIQKDLSVINPQALINGFKQIGTEIQKAYPGIKQVAQIIGKELSADIQFALKWGKQISQWFQSDMLPAIKQAMPGFMSLSKVIINDLAPALARAWAAGQQMYRLFIADFIPVFEKAAPIVTKIAGILANNLSKAIVFLTPYFNQAVVAISGFAKEISDRVMPIVNSFFDGLNANMPALKAIWNATWPVLASVLRGVWDIIVGVVKVAWALLSGIIKIGLDVMSGNWKRAWSDLGSMLQGVWGGIENIISGALRIIVQIVLGQGANIQNALIQPFQAAYNFIGGLLSGLGSLISSTLGGLGGQLHSLHVPGFASGTQSAPGGWAMVGEQGPELAYIPQGTRIVPNNQISSVTQGSNQPVNVNVYLDGARLTGKLMPHIATAIRYGTGVHGI